MCTNLSLTSIWWIVWVYYWVNILRNEHGGMRLPYLFDFWCSQSSWFDSSIPSACVKVLCLYKLCRYPCGILLTKGDLNLHPRRKRNIFSWLVAIKRDPFNTVASLTELGDWRGREVTQWHIIQTHKRNSLHQWQSWCIIYIVVPSANHEGGWMPL